MSEPTAILLHGVFTPLSGEPELAQFGLDLLLPALLELGLALFFGKFLLKNGLLLCDLLEKMYLVIRVVR